MQYSSKCVFELILLLVRYIQILSFYEVILILIIKDISINSNINIVSVMLYNFWKLGNESRTRNILVEQVKYIGLLRM